MTTTNEKRTTTTTESSSTTHARVREAWADISLQTIEDLYRDAFGRPMPPYTAKMLHADLLTGTPMCYYRYAIEEAVSAPFPSWRYVLAIVARLKREKVPEEDFLW